MYNLVRRQFLITTGSLLLGLTVPRVAPGARAKPRRLAFRHLHTGESLTVESDDDGRYDAGALSRIDQIMRDFRSDDVHPIDPKLLEFLYLLQSGVGSPSPFEIISAYRSPKTNAMLRRKSNSVAKRSLHMQGRAIDVRLPGVATSKLRRVAVGLELGGVGYYKKTDFLHLDTGKVRNW